MQQASITDQDASIGADMTPCMLCIFDFELGQNSRFFPGQSKPTFVAFFEAHLDRKHVIFRAFCTTSTSNIARASLIGPSYIRQYNSHRRLQIFDSTLNTLRAFIEMYPSPIISSPSLGGWETSGSQPADDIL